MLAYLFTATPLKFFAQSFWRDEAFSYLLARRNIFEMIALTARDFNPPLYYLLLHFWMKLFGSSEISLRTPSLLFYFGTVYVGFMIMQDVLKIKGKKIFLCVLLLALNPILMYYAFEARMYTMFAFCTALSFYGFLTKKKPLYIAATILGLYTHYFMVLVVIVQFIGTYFTNQNRKEYFLKPVAVFIPWIFFVFISKPPVTSAFWISPFRFTDLLQLPALLYTGYENDFGFLGHNSLFYSFTFVLISLLFLAVIIYGYQKIKHKKHEKIYFYIFFLWTFLPAALVILMSIYKPLFLTRYLIFTSVGLTLLVVFIIERFSKLARIFVLCSLILFSVYYQKQEIKYRTKANLSVTMKEIKSLAKQDDVVYVQSELDFHTAQYYMGEKNLNRVYIYDKSYDLIPWYVGKILITKNNIARALPIYPKKAFLLKADGNYEILSAL